MIDENGRFQSEMILDEYGNLKDGITDDIMRGIYDMSYENIHLVAQYMVTKLDTKTLFGLIHELEAQIRFNKEIKDERI